VVVINDLYENWKGTVRFRLLRDGKTITQETQPCKVAALGSQRLTFAVDIPRQPGSYTIEAALLRPGAQPVRSLRDFDVNAVQPAFMPLRFGTIRPRGWILHQMRRDLKEGFAGHLDELCHEASSDIFASGRNRPGKPNAGNSAGDAWWNGETEGNWHCGHFMLACLTGEPEAMKKAKGYVDHILAAQDADGISASSRPSCVTRVAASYGRKPVSSAACWPMPMPRATRRSWRRSAAPSTGPLPATRAAGKSLSPSTMSCSRTCWNSSMPGRASGNTSISACDCTVSART
jgi:hypothetical protein